MGKYFVGHDRKRTMLVLPDITLLQASFFDIRIKEKRFKEMFNEIPGNVREDSGESLRRFDGMSEKVLGNVQGDFEEFSKRFQEMLEINLKNDQILLSRVFLFYVKEKV